MVTRVGVMGGHTLSTNQLDALPAPPVAKPRAAASRPSDGRAIVIQALRGRIEAVQPANEVARLSGQLSEESSGQHFPIRLDGEAIDVGIGSGTERTV